MTSRVLRASRHFISFEVTFALYLHAGVFKADPRFARIPIDLTALFFVVNVVSGIVILARRRWFCRRASLEICLGYLLFAGWAVTTLLWTPSVLYAREKVLQLCTLVLWAVLGAALVIAPEEPRVRRFFKAIVLLALWVAVETAIAFVGSAKEQVINVLGGTYLPPARLMNVAALLLTANAVLFAKSQSETLLSAVGAILMAGLLLLIGGRGPLLATAGALLVPMSLGVTLHGRDVIRIRPFAAYIGLAGMVATLAVFYLVTSGHMTATLSRLAILLSANHGRSGALRLQYYSSAIQLWLAHPIFGAGIGSWPLLTDKGDIRHYPHNILLEVLSELGIVGASLCFACLATVARTVGSIRRLRGDPRALLLVTLLAAGLFNASVSGDLNDNRFVFAVLGLFPIVAVRFLSRTEPRVTDRPDIPYSRVTEGLQ